MRNILVGIFLLLLGYVNVVSAINPTVRWRDGRTNQGISNVDEITGMVEGDWVIVLEGTGADSNVYIYRYDANADCSPAADGRKRINGTAANDCWYLSRFNVMAIIGQADDGEHFIDMSNSSDLDSNFRMDGRCWYDKEDNRIECFDGVNIQYWTPTGTE